MVRERVNEIRSVKSILTEFIEVVDYDSMPMDDDVFKAQKRSLSSSHLLQQNSQISKPFHFNITNKKKILACKHRVPFPTKKKKQTSRIISWNLSVSLENEFPH